MKLLALETSSSSASVCILVEGKILSFMQSSRPRFHSQWVHKALLEALHQAKLSLSEIDCFAVGRGPGSFTGLRVGGSVMKTFAFLFQKPIVAVDSLTILAYPFLQSPQSKELSCVVMIQAHTHQIYWSTYPKTKTSLNQEAFLKDRPIQVDFPRDLHLAGEEKRLCLGNAFNIYFQDLSPSVQSKLFREKTFSDEPSAESLALIAWQRYRFNKTLKWNEYIPLYIRPSSAEEKIKGTKKRP